MDVQEFAKRMVVLLGIFPIRFLNLKTCQETLEMITPYYPLERFPQKTLYALEEIFEKKIKPPGIA